MQNPVEKVNHLVSLIKEVEKEDPIDFSDIKENPDNLRQLAAISILEMEESFGQALDLPDVIEAYRSACAKLALENLTLHLKLLKS